MTTTMPAGMPASENAHGSGAMPEPPTTRQSGPAVRRTARRSSNLGCGGGVSIARTVGTEAPLGSLAARGSWELAVLHGSLLHVTAAPATPPRRPPPPPP